MLATAGLLDGRRATVHWMWAELLAERFPKVTIDPDVLYVDDGDILTSAGSAGGIDLCLHLVRLDLGAEMADLLARRLVVPPHRAGGQAQYVETPLAARDGDSLAPLLQWAVEHLDRPLTIADLARRQHLTARTLIRRFHAVTGTSPSAGCSSSVCTAPASSWRPPRNPCTASPSAVASAPRPTCGTTSRASWAFPPGQYRRSFNRSGT